MSHGVDDLADDLHAMATFRNGERLANAARELARHLPQGPLHLMSSSLEGIALCGAACAVAGRRDISWTTLNIVGIRQAATAQVVVVEPINPGAGWCESVVGLYPDAVLYFAYGSIAELAA